MFSWRGFLRTFGQVLNIVAIFVPQLQLFAQIFNGIMAYANGGLKGGLLNAFTSMIPGLNSVPGIWDNIGNLAISAAVGGLSAVVMGGRFKEGAIGSLKSAAISMTLSAIAVSNRSAQTGNKGKSGADSKAMSEATGQDRVQNTGGKSPADPKLAAAAVRSARIKLLVSGFYLKAAFGAFKTDQAYAEEWTRLVLPIAERYQVEIGTSIVQSGNHFIEESMYSSGAYDWAAVNLTEMTVAVAHTHPMVPGGEHLSGKWGHAYANNSGHAVHGSMEGDMVLAFSKQINIYSRGGLFGSFSAWNYNGYMNNTSSTPGSVGLDFCKTMSVPSC